MTALEALELPLGTQFNVYDCDNNFVTIVASKEISEIGNNDVILYNIEKGNEIKLVRSLNDYDFRKHKEPISFNEILKTQTNVQTKQNKKQQIEPRYECNAFGAYGKHTHHYPSQ